MILALVILLFLSSCFLYVWHVSQADKYASPEEFWRLEGMLRSFDKKVAEKHPKATYHLRRAIYALVSGVVAWILAILINFIK